MKKHLAGSRQGYSIIAAVMMIGFLLVLTTSTLNLVLQEMQDGKGRQDYLKAFAGAEGSMELALLQIKEYGYGYFDVKTGIDTLSDSSRSIDLRYSFDTKVSSYNGKLRSYETEIIPLFYIDSLGQYSVSDVELTVPGLNIIWNIVGSNGGVSGQGSFNATSSINNKVIDDSLGNQDFDVQSVTVENFLLSNPASYLVLYNADASGTVSDYELKSISGDSFSKPISTVVSTAKIGKYSQNLKTQIDNTEFLGILRYSIYSGN